MNDTLLLSLLSAWLAQLTTCVGDDLFPSSAALTRRLGERAGVSEVQHIVIGGPSEARRELRVLAQPADASTGSE